MFFLSLIKQFEKLFPTINVIILVSMYAMKNECYQDYDEMTINLRLENDTSCFVCLSGQRKVYNN